MKGLYALLLYLFPRAYREEYGEELQTVFGLSLEEARRGGTFDVVQVLLREWAALPGAILHEHLRKPRRSLAAEASVFEKDGYMKIMPDIEWEEMGSWKATLASLVPLWSLFFAFANIDDSRLKILEAVEVIAFYLILPVCIIFFLRKGWMTLDLLLYSFLPMFVQFFYDDIDSSCKLFLKLLCTLTLTLGVVGYQRSLNRESVTLAWSSLLLAAVAAWIVVSYASQNFCG